jgi:hypothetical protein
MRTIIAGIDVDRRLKLGVSEPFVLKTASLPTPRGEDPLWPGGRRKAREASE